MEGEVCVQTRVCAEPRAPDLVTLIQYAGVCSAENPRQLQAVSPSNEGSFCARPSGGGGSPLCGAALGHPGSSPATGNQCLHQVVLAGKAHRTEVSATHVQHKAKGRAQPELRLAPHTDPPVSLGNTLREQPPRLPPPCALPKCTGDPLQKHKCLCGRDTAGGRHRTRGARVHHKRQGTAPPDSARDKLLIGPSPTRPPGPRFTCSRPGGSEQPSARREPSSQGPLTPGQQDAAAKE